MVLFRQTTSQSILKTAGTQPNEDSFKLQGSQRDSEEAEEDQFTGGQWLEESLFEELEELTKVSKKNHNYSKNSKFLKIYFRR